jgi:hypothetical protein
MREVLYSIRGPKTMFEMTWEERPLKRRIW